jgi:hypothetical protein
MKKKVKNRKIQTIHTNCYLLDLIDQPKTTFRNLPPNQIFNLEVDYPLSKPYPTFAIRTGKKGMTLDGILREVGKAYKKVYANTDKYGIWGHDIGDLHVEGIQVNFKTKHIYLSMGS